MNRRLTVIAATFAAAVLLHWYLNMPVPIPEPWRMPPWQWQLSSLFTGLFAVVPGVVVGSISGRHGLLLGGLVGYLGHALAVLPLELAGISSSSVAMAILGFALAPLGHAIISAAGGGAGQLLRSNTSLERLRDR